MKKKISLSFLLFLITSQSYANEPTPSDNFWWPLGTLSTRSMASLSVSEDGCSEKDTVFINANEFLPVAGILTCKKSYNNGIKKYFITAYRGQITYISEEYLTVTKEVSDQLAAITPEELVVRKEVIAGASLDSYSNKLDAVTKKLEGTKKNGGVTILHYGVFDESEYTDGTGVEIGYYNSSSKIIKYITATFIGYNAVKDPVNLYSKNSSIVTLKGIGPIKPGESGSYTKSYAWHTDSVESVKIKSVKILYMDGTSNSIKNIPNAILDKESYKFLKSLD